MTDDRDPAAVARSIIDANLYMVLGTADEDGRPWVSPVYYAPASYREFLWVSEPEAKHSRNVATRPEISVVIFDSQVPINTGQAVYMSAVASSSPAPTRRRQSTSSPAEGWGTVGASSLSWTSGRRRTCASIGRPPQSSTSSTSTTTASR